MHIVELDGSDPIPASRVHLAPLFFQPRGHDSLSLAVTQSDHEWSRPVPNFLLQTQCIFHDDTSRLKRHVMHF